MLGIRVLQISRNATLAVAVEGRENGVEVIAKIVSRTIIRVIYCLPRRVSEAMARRGLRTPGRYGLDHLRRICRVSALSAKAFFDAI